MVAVRSCELDQLAFVKIGERFAHIGGKGGNISVIFFGQVAHDLTQCSPVAAGKNFLRGFVQFDDAFRKKQTVLPVAGSSCSRTPLAIRGWAASEIGLAAINMMNRIEH